MRTLTENQVMFIVLGLLAFVNIAILTSLADSLDKVFKSLKELIKYIKNQ